MQSAAAIESPSDEITIHGPAAHLGSGDENERALKILGPLGELIDEARSLERFNLILYLLSEPIHDHERRPGFLLVLCLSSNARPGLLTVVFLAAANTPPAPSPEEEADRKASRCRWAAPRTA